MTGEAKFLRNEAIAHLVRAVAGVSGQSSFVMIVTGAVIAQWKHVPLDLKRTREIDIYTRGVPDAEKLSTLIDGTLGEGSPFDQTFGYSAHGVGERTACLPDHWEERAIRFEYRVSRVSSACVRRSTTSRYQDSAPGGTRTGPGLKRASTPAF